MKIFGPWGYCKSFCSCSFKALYQLRVGSGHIPVRGTERLQHILDKSKKGNAVPAFSAEGVHSLIDEVLLFSGDQVALSNWNRVQTIPSSSQWHCWELVHGDGWIFLPDDSGMLFVSMHRTSKWSSGRVRVLFTKLSQMVVSLPVKEKNNNKEYENVSLTGGNLSSFE